jgi:hypothetical protein
MYVTTRGTLGAALLACFALAGCGGDNGTGSESGEAFSARIESGEVVPPEPGQLAGAVGFNYDGQAIAFSADLRNLDLSGTNRFVRLRIHSGTRGTNGPPLAGAMILQSELSAAGGQVLWQGRLGPEQLDLAASVQEVVAAMREGRAYVQVRHWQIMNAGENSVAAARGQIASDN